ncbi:hypothetical protein UFOVP240_54 [uncultured Caudovirales phage]|uniref:Uncharacterized protein n=1 Tax=uncultured Caudovirales phage TaxID=2100421 RepID=A0A6J7WXY2_9CAUD|nr:hypothetical protein UFOVP240_54 [uncultured Caudovirales phage]
MKTFVIAGNWNEFTYYTRDKILNGTSYVYVSSPDTLRGHQDIHGMFIGTWRERKDIADILDTLITRTTNTDVIKDLYQQIYYGQPAATITHKPYNTRRTIKELEDEIAEEISRILQKEIDEQMVRNIISS